MKTLTLYSTVGCHLCEQALELVQPMVAERYRVKIIDIAETDELIACYGVRIPVIARDDGLEIGWPFDSVAFNEFLDQ